MATDVATRMTTDVSVFKEAMSRFPSGVVIVTTKDRNGELWGFTASSFSSVSLDPPLAMVCLSRTAECYPAFDSVQWFAISVLTASDQSLAARFSKRGSDKFAGLSFTTDQHGSPVMPSAVATLTCRRFDVYPCGDHAILVGRVKTATLGSDNKPMIYCGRNFGRFTPAMQDGVRNQLTAILATSVEADRNHQPGTHCVSSWNQRAAEVIRHCTRCGSDVVTGVPQGDTVSRHICRQCGKIHYINPTVVVGCIAEAADGRILMCRRRISPRRGYWTFPSGFLECGESATAGACREAFEEARAQVHIEGLLCVIDVPQIGEVHLVYRGILRASTLAPTAESSEVTLMSESDVPWDDLAFTSVGESLSCYFDDRRQSQQLVHMLDLRSAPQGDNREDEVAR
jgi:flavin reductase (DIM6/NTAB) family NADH-FMN oxidoreductase RutF/ADP-ribose pyrophosphatase YjhB (NUDIX family)